MAEILFGILVIGNLMDVMKTYKIGLDIPVNQYKQTLLPRLLEKISQTK